MTAPGSPEHRARLLPVLETLDAAGESTFLDLCVLVEMLAERVSGSLRWQGDRVIVNIKQKPRPKKAKKVVKG